MHCANLDPSTASVALWLVEKKTYGELQQKLESPNTKKVQH